MQDEEKEPLVQRAAVRLLGQCAIVLVITMTLLAAPGLVIWGGHAIGIATFAAVYDFLLNWYVIIGATVLLLATMVLLRRR